MSTLEITRANPEEIRILVGDVPYSFLCIHLNSNGRYLVEGIGFAYLQGEIEPNLPVKESIKQLLDKFKADFLYLMKVEDKITEELENFANDDTPFEI